jgi:hypothetical protein
MSGNYAPDGWFDNDRRQMQSQLVNQAGIEVAACERSAAHNDDVLTVRTLMRTVQSGS